MKETRNSKALKSFAKYCEEHPEERFWQALRNWSGYGFIIASNSLPVNRGQVDTFHWEYKVK